MFELRVAEKYKLGRKIASGTFGDVYHGTDTTNGDEVAIKLERVRAKHPQLLHESKVYGTLQGGTGIANMRWFGAQGDYNGLIVDLLGPTLEELFDRCNRRFQLQTVLMIAEQLVERLEFLHSKSYILRDVKPENFLIGAVGALQSVIHVVDFGLARQYCDDVTQVHIPYDDQAGFVGSLRYASQGATAGKQQSRRDDLESVGFMLVYFLVGKLPWQNMKGDTKEQKTLLISEMKTSTSLEQLCENCPKEFFTYLEYCRSLPFDALPDYAYLKSLFKSLFDRMGYLADNLFDWTTVSPPGVTSLEASR